MKKNALICEDSLTTAYCIKEMLKKLNYDSEIATTAKDTLNLLNENKYDLLTLDVLLPDGNGLELINQIKNITSAKDLPIIVISATKQDADDQNELTCKNNGICWIEKSFDMKSFEETLDKVSTERNNLEILHVENDEDILNITSLILNDIAIVKRVKTLTEAEKVVETEAFDIIILDYVFPEGTSDKLIPIIKSGINKNAKIVIFSAYEESRIINKYVDKVLIKTIVSFEELKDCIEKM